MAALNMTANTVCAVKAQRVVGVRRVAAKLKAPVSMSMHKGTWKTKQRIGIFSV